VTASDEDNVKIWDIRDITHIQLWTSLERHKGRTLCAVFSPDDDRLVTTGDDKFARLWDIRLRFARLWDTRLREQNLLELVTTIDAFSFSFAV
jgi:WD40 repeat protein